METWQSWKRRALPGLAVVYTRYLLGGAFVFASVVKMKGHRFTSLSGAADPIASAPHLFETLYQSGLYWQFLGVAQCLAGFLLLTQRFATLGALLFLPIITNIFAITISYDFGGTPLITGLMLLANLLLLAWDWPTLRVLVGRPALPPVPGPQARLWEVVGLVLFAFTAGYRCYADAYNLLLWAGGCTLVGALGLLAAWGQRRRGAPLPAGE